MIRVRSAHPIVLNVSTQYRTGGGAARRVRALPFPFSTIQAPGRLGSVKLGEPEGPFSHAAFSCLTDPSFDLQRRPVSIQETDTLIDTTSLSWPSCSCGIGMDLDRPRQGCGEHTNANLPENDPRPLKGTLEDFPRLPLRPQQVEKERKQLPSDKLPGLSGPLVFHDTKG